MVNFLTRLILSTLGAVVTATVFGWIVAPSMVSTILTVVPFLLLSIVAFLYMDLTGSSRAASVAYLIGLFPFSLWIFTMHVIFRCTPGLNDELAGLLMITYLISAAGAYLCLICSRSRAMQKSSHDRRI